MWNHKTKTCPKGFGLKVAKLTQKVEELAIVVNPNETKN